jgi:hypothetical protein
VSSASSLPSWALSSALPPSLSRRPSAPQTVGTSDADFQPLGSTQGTLGVQGWVSNLPKSKSTADANFITLSKVGGMDIANLFTDNKCNGLEFGVAQDASRSSLTPLPALSS